MRTSIAALAVVLTSGRARSRRREQACEIPAYLLQGSYPLKRVEEAVKERQRLTIAVVGTGSSILAGPDGPRAPIRRGWRRRSSGFCLGCREGGHPGPHPHDDRGSGERHDEAAGRREAGSGDMADWDPRRHSQIEADIFRTALEEGVGDPAERGADVILMNMQYSPGPTSWFRSAPIPISCAWSLNSTRFRCSTGSPSCGTGPRWGPSTSTPPARNTCSPTGYTIALGARLQQ